MKNRPLAKRLAFDGLMIATAIVLSVLDHMIPLQLLIPLPGVKLGLANVVSLFVLFRVSLWDTLLIVVLRCTIMIALTGPTVFLFSLAGGLLAVLAIALTKQATPRVFSLIGVSVAGAVSHNTGQILVAAWMMQEVRLIYLYLPFLLLIGAATGSLTGVTARLFLRHLPAFGQLSAK